MMIILKKTMNFEEWEVPTPQSEKIDSNSEDLFKMPPELTKSIH
jgi:hypothetical protein